MTYRIVRTYRIARSNGTSAGAGLTYEEALAALRAEGCTEVGHDGDLRGGGDRTLAWLTAEDARDDDGARAYASILRES